MLAGCQYANNSSLVDVRRKLTLAVVDVNNRIAILESFNQSTNQSLGSLRSSVDCDKSVGAFGLSVCHGECVGDCALAK